MTVAALFVRTDSIYKSLPDVDAWDINRDARKWPGGMPAVCHPPCRSWGVLKHVAKPEPGEKELAPYAVELVRRNGGVLEHPAGSSLWAFSKLPEDEAPDEYGGWTLLVDQYSFGHRAMKYTRLYIVGCAPDNLPPIPVRAGIPTHVVTNSHGLREGDPGFKSRVTDREREATPPAFAEWLLEVARRCSPISMEPTR